LEEPALSAVIVNYATAGRLPALLAALRAQGVALETIVVDSASPDREAARGAGADRFIELAENRGFGAAANEGARAARAPVVAFVNPDVTLAPGTLRALLDAIADCAAVGPRLVDASGAHQVGDCGEAPSVPRALSYALGAGGLFHRAASA
jgi:GT2 family glycosyltransferase